MCGMLKQILIEGCIGSVYVRGGITGPDAYISIDILTSKAIGLIKKKSKKRKRKSG